MRLVEIGEKGGVDAKAAQLGKDQGFGRPAGLHNMREVGLHHLEGVRLGVRP